ncbi:hypothetical protein Tco_1506911 [Tanacetum coccineum]
MNIYALSRTKLISAGRLLEEIVYIDKRNLLNVFNFLKRPNVNVNGCFIPKDVVDQELIKKSTSQEIPTSPGDGPGGPMSGLKAFLMLLVLVLLKNFKEKNAKCLLLLVHINVAEEVNAASEEVSTAELEEVVPKVDDVSLVDGVFNGVFGGDGEEDFVIREGVIVSSSSLDMFTKSCLDGMMVSLIFLEGLEEEDWVESMEVEEK